MRMKYILLILLLFTFLGTSNGQSSTKSNDNSKPKPEISVGLWIDQIGNIDYGNNTYEVVFYLWINSTDSIYDFKNNFDLANSWNSEILYNQIDSIDYNGEQKFWKLIKIKAKNSTNLNFSDFPFDKNLINLDVELVAHNVGDIKINLDQNNSNINPELYKQWKIKIFPIKHQKIQWGSEFGSLKNLSEGDSIRSTLELSRNAWPIYFKLFSILFLSFILASLSLFLPNQKSGEKVAIVVGALFAAIGNKYITESIIPISNNFGLSDQIHFTTISFILLFILITIIEQRGEFKDSFKFDFLIFIISSISYLLIITLITLNHIF